MSAKEKRGKQEENVRVNEKGILYCPKCGGKTRTKVLPRTVLKQFPLFCPWCKRETIIDIPEKPEPKSQI